MSVVAPAPAAPARPRRAPAAPPSPRTRTRGRKAPLARPRAGRSPVAPGVLWVLLIAVLLGGIVALNVGALRNSIEASRVGGQVAALRSQNHALLSQVAGQSGFGQISHRAAQLGMVLAQPAKRDFIRLHPGKRPATPATTVVAPAGHHGRHHGRHHTTSFRTP